MGGKFSVEENKVVGFYVLVPQIISLYCIRPIKVFIGQAKANKNRNTAKIQWKLNILLIHICI